MLVGCGDVVVPPGDLIGGLVHRLAPLIPEQDEVLEDGVAPQHRMQKLKPRVIFSFRTAWIVHDVRLERVDVLLQLRARRLDELEARLCQLLG
jgi:hypothetical protein